MVKVVVFLAKKTATTDKLKKSLEEVVEVGRMLSDVRESVYERINFWSR